MGMTITEKIIARAAGRAAVRPGDIVYVEPDLVVSSDYNIIRHLKSLKEEFGVERIWNPEKVIPCFHHGIPAHSQNDANKHAFVRQFVEEQGIKYFYDIGRSGIAHILMAEEGHALPGFFYASDDSASITLGAMGCMSCAYGPSLLETFALGRLWVRVPATIQLRLNGRLAPGVSPRDIAMLLCSTLGLGGAEGHAVELCGPVIDELNLEGRMTLTNQLIHVEAKNAIINPDAKTLAYAQERAKHPFTPVASDPDAEYLREIAVDVSDLTPQIALPDDPFNVVPVGHAEGTPVHQAVIGSCTNGRFSDFEAAAAVLRDRKVHPQVRLLVVPGSQNVQIELVRSGLAEVFLRAGAMVTSAGCGPCFGGHTGVLAEGEVCITSTITNAPGRMGSGSASIYLASPATVAASAAAGRITDPRNLA